MRKLGVVFVVGLALTLGACAGFPGFSDSKSVLVGGTSITAEVKNPAGKRELAQAELGYQAASKLFVACVRARCVGAENLRTYQAYDQKAYATLVAARRVVRKNPTVSGLSAVAAARQAVADFQFVLAGGGI